MFLSVTVPMDGDGAELSRIGATYLRLLRRRLVSTHGDRAGMAVYQSFIEGLSVVKEFAGLIATMFLPMMQQSG